MLDFPSTAYKTYPYHYISGIIFVIVYLFSCLVESDTFPIYR